MRTFIMMVLLCALGGAPLTARTREEASNARISRAFVDTVFNRHRVTDAFERYVGAEYVQHNPRVGTGREAGIKALSGLVEKFPKMHVDIVRVVADGDLVALHTHEVKQPSERGAAVAEFFRLSKGRIVEHRDVIQDVPDPVESRNSNTIF